MIRFIFFLFIYASSILAATGTNSYLNGLPEKGQIVPSTHEVSSSPWQIQTQNGWELAAFPVWTDSATGLRLGNRFKLSVKADSLPVWLYLSGISGTVRIYLNKTMVGFHTNDTGPFILRLPLESLSQNNELLLHIEPPSGDTNGFPVYATQFAEERQIGIRISPKILQETNQEIKNFKLSIDKLAQKASIQYAYDIFLPESKVKYRIDETIRSAGYQRNRYVKGGLSHIKGKLSIPLSQLWNPEKPYLIQTEITITDRNTVLGRYQYQTGLRTIAYKNKVLLINGHEIPIRGINYHLDLKRYQAGYESDIHTDFLNIKNLGFNSIRLLHHLPDEFMLDQADSLGLLLFAELPIQRLPLPFFYSDDFLENAKTAIKNLKNLSTQHPSLTAIGLGQEISLKDAATQKFMFILKGEVNSKLNLLSYISPFPCQGLPPENTADFYLLSSYYPLHKLNPLSVIQHADYAYAGRIGSIWNEQVYLWDKDPASVKHQKFLRREFDALFNIFKLKGGFLESYMDWHMQLPSSSDLKFTKDAYINTSGLYSLNRTPKYWIQDFRELWKGNDSTLLPMPDKTKQNNLFSLTVIFGSLLFFAIYRKQPRMKENIRKAMRHPYGFFVDMRERRIIPLFNSFMVGGYAALLLGSIFGALLYFYHSSYKVMEAAAILLRPLGLYRFFVYTSSNPLFSLLFSFSVLLLFPIIVSFFIKFIALLSGERLRYRQGLAIGLWSGVPLFFLLPVSLVIYQILLWGGYEKILFVLLALFLIWAHARILNGIRVLFITRMTKVIIAMLLSYIIPLVIFWAVFTPMPLWPDYLKLVTQAKCLF